jgi:FkbM family methyltransferase
MLAHLRKLLRRGLRITGYDFCKAIDRRDYLVDMKALSPSAPVIFDVGANTGQTIASVKRVFPNCIIHAFEPGKIAFSELQQSWRNCESIFLNSVALGAETEIRVFNESHPHDMSSFLDKGDSGWGDLKDPHDVQITTIDHYCSRRSIEHIDILKTDTQGFDLEVLKGARQMMSRGAIELVYLEINFAQIYKNLPPVDEILRFLRKQNFEPVAFYRFHYIDKKLGWTDALFKIVR